MPISNSYTLLAQSLSPALSLDTKENILHVIRMGGVDWKDLLLQANYHVVTPLWFLNLRRNNLHTELPQALAEYLTELHAVNCERNKSLCNALTEILETCDKAGLSPVLLKGAATFADDLYGDIGARVQSDLDLLLHPDEAPILSERLQQAGYQIVPRDDVLVDNTAPTADHHHLKALCKPGTPAFLEIHYRIARGRVGALLDGASTIATTVSGLPCKMLTPEWRDLNNLLHAMVNDRGTINSYISLKAAAESAWLRNSYPDANYSGLAKVADDFGCGRDYRLYRAVTQRLGLWPGEDEITKNVSTSRVNRCLEHGGSLTDERKSLALALYLKLYERLNYPRWAWDYICYMDSSSSTWDRMKKMGSYLVRPASWKKI